MPDGVRVYETDLPTTLTPQERADLFVQKIADVFNNALVELDAGGKKLVVKGDYWTERKNRRTGYRNDPKLARYNLLYDWADILSHATYDPESTQEEDSHADPTKPPKNPAHKDVAWWYHFKTTVGLDGWRYRVDFSIRDMVWEEQFQYVKKMTRRGRLGNISNPVEPSRGQASPSASSGEIIAEASGVVNPNDQRSSRRSRLSSIDMVDAIDNYDGIDESVAQSLRDVKDDRKNRTGRAIFRFLLQRRAKLCILTA